MQQTVVNPHAAAPAVPPGLLFTTSAPGASTYNNQFGGWFNAGSTVSTGDGKYAAYDSLVASSFRFDIGGETATFSVATPTTMLGLVNAAGLTGSPTNTGSGAWIAGLASYSFDTRSSTSASGPFPSATLRVGVGDTHGDSADWGLFMFESGSQTDFLGDNVKALGSERCTGWWRPRRARDLGLEIQQSRDLGQSGMQQ